MDSLKRFDIRLTDIWIECQNEMIELKHKIIDLKSCLNTSEQINKHLIKCNEILVSIIEKCKIDDHKNKGLNDLIKTIKKEEECIETEKQNLKKIKNQIKSDLNEQKVYELINRWNLNKSLKTSTEEKSIQTSDSFVYITENMVNNNNIDSETKTENESQELVTNHIEDEIDGKSDNSVIDDVLDVDTDVEYSPETNTKELEKKRKAKRKEGLRRTQRINSVVMRFKVDNQYICDEIDCDFSSGTKRVFYRHIIQEHRDLDTKDNESKALKDKQIRINETISPFKVVDEYICTSEECHFKTKTKIVFYCHLREHKPIKKRNPPEVKSNDSERPYICDWPACGMAFKRPQHLRGHRNRHLGKRDYVCDWPGCGAQMYTSHNYYTHRLTHTDERPWKCEWPACVYSCNQKWALVAHKRIHTGEKPYLCPFPECGYRCSQPCTMVSHKRKHTGEKPYECEVPDCGKRFSSLAGIWTHRKTHQKREMKNLKMQKYKRDETPPKKSKVKEVTKPFKRRTRNKQRPIDVTDLIGESVSITNSEMTTALN